MDATRGIVAGMQTAVAGAAIAVGLKANEANKVWQEFATAPITAEFIDVFLALDNAIKNQRLATTMEVVDE